MSQVSDIIHSICEEKGWSLRELARRADLPPATVHKIATSDSQPRVDTLEALAYALGVSNKVLLQAAAADSGYVNTDTTTDRGLQLLISSIQELSPERQKELSALVEAMLQSERNA